jgi:hypothetical protein
MGLLIFTKVKKLGKSEQFITHAYYIVKSFMPLYAAHSKKEV